MGRFKKGLFLGGLLGAGAMWLNTTKKGKETRAQMLDVAGKVYQEVKEKVVHSEAFDTMSKSAFVAKVSEIVDKYAIENGLADNVKKTVTKLVGAQYTKLKKKKKAGSK